MLVIKRSQNGNLCNLLNMLVQLIGEDTHYTGGVFTKSCCSKKVDHTSLTEQLIEIASDDNSVEKTVNTFNMLIELLYEFIVHAQYDPNI